MSFIRFSENSDIYIFAHYLGYVECCGCKLFGTFEARDLDSLIEHVGDHRIQGHLVPDGFEDRLREIVEPSDFLPEDAKKIDTTGKEGQTSRVKLDADWLDELMNILSGWSNGSKAPRESMLEQHIRLAIENTKARAIKTILDKHRMECNNSDTSCTHLDDVKIIEESE